jgi:hypothetical protein
MLRDVGVDRLAPEQDAAVGLEVEEDGAGDQRVVTFDGGERGAPSRTTPSAEFDVPKSRPQAAMRIPFRCREGALI